MIGKVWFKDLKLFAPSDVNKISDWVFFFDYTLMKILNNFFYINDFIGKGLILSGLLFVLSLNQQLLSPWKVEI